jgi:hypothetical protein
MISAATKPDEREHIIRTAQRYADEIVRGVVSPYDGGRRIWRECQLELKTGDHRLDPFVYWTSEYEETTSKKRRALCDKALRHAAASLIEHGSAV